MNIALIGPSGAGKGTHAFELIERFGFSHIATGELFRENLENRTALGLLARQYLKEGALVPDEIVDAMIEERVRKATDDRGILFDGFPRTVCQAAFIDELFHETGRELTAVVYLKVSDVEIVRRLSGRMICHKCHAPFHKVHNPYRSCPGGECHGEHLYQRTDDVPERVKHRLEVFHRSAGSLLEYYMRDGRLWIVEGEDEMLRVRRRLMEAGLAIQKRERVTATRDDLEQVRLGRAETATYPIYYRAGANLVLLGAPGSGKGTQAEHLAGALHLAHVATGDLFREHLKGETELGKVAKTYMARGELVPDDITEGMVRERLNRPDVQEGFILDGFPRTLTQAEALAEILGATRRRVSGVLYLHVSDEEIVRRLGGRLICRACQSPYHVDFKPPARAGQCDLCGGELYRRADDSPDTVRARLRTFHRQTEPLVQYYSKQGLLVEVEGEGDLGAVKGRMLQAAKDLTQDSNLQTAV